MEMTNLQRVNKIAEMFQFLIGEMQDLKASLPKSVPDVEARELSIAITQAQVAQSVFRDRVYMATIVDPMIFDRKPESEADRRNPG